MPIYSKTIFILFWSLYLKLFSDCDLCLCLSSCSKPINQLSFILVLCRTSWIHVIRGLHSILSCVEVRLVFVPSSAHNLKGKNRDFYKFDIFFIKIGGLVLMLIAGSRWSSPGWNKSRRNVWESFRAKLQLRLPRARVQVELIHKNY